MLNPAANDITSGYFKKFLALKYKVKQYKVELLLHLAADDITSGYKVF